MEAVEWSSIGERVRECRIAAGISQTDLAQKVGLDRTMLAKIEAGKRRLDALELARFASVLEMPMEHFLEDRPLVLSRRAQLVDVGESEADWQSYQLEAKLIQWRQDVRHLVDLGLLAPNRPKLYPHPVENAEAARDAARWLRADLDNELDPIETLMAVCEHAGQLVLVADSPGEGASLIDGGIAVAIVSRAGDPGRRRATAAHELGHLILGDEYSTDLGVAASREDREKAIDAFAAELLLPAEVLVKQQPGSATAVRPWLIGLAARYRTSWSMTVRHAMSADVIDEATARRLRSSNPTRAELMESLGWAPQVDLESVTVPPSYAHAVMEALSRDMITSDRAVEMMHGQVSLQDLPPRDTARLVP